MSRGRPARSPAARFALGWILGAALPCAAPVLAVPQPEDLSPLPPWRADRGAGLPTSQFGTYVRSHEWLLYAFYEYTKTTGFEYAPDELGFHGGEEFSHGDLREHESLLYTAYGLSDRMMFEAEAAVHADTTLHKDPADLSDLPDPLRESGLGDVEGQFRWRWSDETAHRPEMWSFFEMVLPLQRDRVLIGTQDWEFSLGFGATRGFRWGTLTGRMAAGYSEGQLELGEYAIEYLKRLSSRVRVLAAVEGEQTDEIAAILEAQVRFSPHVLLKLNCGFGLTSKAPDLAPEVGLLFSF